MLSLFGICGCDSTTHGSQELAFVDGDKELLIDSLDPRSPFNSKLRVLYLNFEGQAVTKAQASDSTKNLSFLCGTTIPPFSHTPFGRDRAKVIQHVADQVQDQFAAFKLDVKTSRPKTGLYEMVVIGGTPSICGFPSGHVGMSHLDCEDSIHTDLAFVFSEGITSLEMLSVVIAHETAHTFGLVHTTEGCDVMSNYICSNQSKKRFLDQQMTVAPDHKDKCGGFQTTNSWKKLQAILGLRQTTNDGASVDKDALSNDPRSLDAGATSADSESIRQGGGCMLSGKKDTRRIDNIPIYLFFLLLWIVRVLKWRRRASGREQ